MVGLTESASAWCIALVCAFLATVVPTKHPELEDGYIVSKSGSIVVCVFVFILLLVLTVVQVMGAASLAAPREWLRLEHWSGLSRLKFSVFGSGIDQLNFSDILVNSRAEQEKAESMKAADTAASKGAQHLIGEAAPDSNSGHPELT